MTKKVSGITADCKKIYKERKETIMIFKFVNTDIKSKFAEANRVHNGLLKSNPVFLRRSGAREFISKGLKSKIEIGSEDDAADIRRQPFRLFLLKPNPPNGYRLLIQNEFFKDEPLFEGAPCTYVDIITVWCGAYIINGFLDIPSKYKTVEQILEERDLCLAFAYVYYGITYEEVMKNI